MPILVVDKELHQVKVNEIWDQRQDKPNLKEANQTKNKLQFREDTVSQSSKLSQRDRYQVLLKRELTCRVQALASNANHWASSVDDAMT